MFELSCRWSLNAGYFLMDLYKIVDELSLSESVASIVAATESTMATTSSAAVTESHCNCVLLHVVLFFFSFLYYI